jgi:3-oxoacyl-[acyl-carrier protein] reductase
LAAAGARVALVAQSAERLSAAQTALPSGAVSVSIAADLRDPGASDIVRERVIRPWGGIDGLVNCAGAAKVGDFLAFNEADWDDGFALKFSAARRLSQRFWSDLAASSGVIVNIVGSAGRTPGADYVLAGSVNSAMLGLTKALAARGIRDGVRVNAINPGPIETDRLRGHIERIAREQGIDEGAARASLQATYGVTRFGAPEDVAALVRYVVSPAGRMLHGAIIDIDGGLTKTI